MIEKDFKNSIERQKFQMKKKALEDISNAIKNIPETTEKIEIVGAELVTIQGPEGKPGKDANEELIIKTVLSKILQPKDGKDGKDAIIDYPLIWKYVEKEVTKIPKAKDGKDGKDGKDIDIESLVKKVLSKIPKAKEVKSVTVEDVIDRIKGLKKEWISPDSIIGGINRATPRGSNSLKSLTDVDYSNLSQDSNGNFILGSGITVNGVNVNGIVFSGATVTYTDGIAYVTITGGGGGGSLGMLLQDGTSLLLQDGTELLLQS